ncbi:sensor histidine kinase [Paenibacillus germinis]|nr:sensor histidine kinase [Paenibacillus germinis]
MNTAIRRMQSLFFYPKRNLRAKLFLFFLIVAIIPLNILGYLSYAKSSQIVQAQIGQYGQSAVNQLQAQLDTYASQMQMTSRYIYSYLLDPLNNTLHEEESSSYASFLDQKNFERFLDAHKTMDSTGIYLITQSGYYYGSPQINVDRLRQSDWWKAIPSGLHGEYWTGFHAPDYYIARNLNLPDQVMGFVFPLSSQYGTFTNGFIFIEVDATKVLDSFRMLEGELHSFVSIRDASGRAIYTTPQTAMSKADDLVWTKTLESNKWTVEVRTPYEQVYRSVNVIQPLTAVVIAGTLLLALIVSFLFSSQITKRIKRLKNKMELVGIGKLHSRIDLGSEDELGRLGNSFNSMVEQIQTLIQEVTKKEQLKKEAELRAFHYQINPHLLLNTLNSIQWQAKLKGDDEIRQTIYHLTKVLEGSLITTQELVPLHKELRTVEHYLKIQEVRYGGAFEFQSSVEEELNHYLIPRMTLQPLLENCFFHGFEDGEGTIKLTVAKHKGELMLVLADNGEGIPEQRLATLLDEQMPRSGRGGLGCFNVDQKFKLHFGEQYGMKIESQEGNGTTITIRWPMKEEIRESHNPLSNKLPDGSDKMAHSPEKFE